MCIKMNFWCVVDDYGDDTDYVPSSEGENEDTDDDVDDDDEEEEMEKSEKGEDFVSNEKTDETQMKQINQVIGKQLTAQHVHFVKGTGDTA